MAESANSPATYENDSANVPHAAGSSAARPRSGEGKCSGRAIDLCSWLLSAGNSAAAFYLVFFHTGPAQTLGVSLKTLYNRLNLYEAAGQLEPVRSEAGA